MFCLNPNYQIRDNLLGIGVNWEEEENKDDLVEFDDLEYQNLSQLISAGFIDPRGTQNRSPTFQEFADFIARHPEAKAFGYAISPYREDYRISLTGVVVDEENASDDLKTEFMKFAENADELDLTGDLYCWWD